MQSHTIPMTEAEFHRLPRKLGWKYEYVCGTAVIRPQNLVGRLRAPVTPRLIGETGCRLRPVSAEDAPGLIRAFRDGFADTVEYCDATPAEIARAGTDAITTFFAGRRGAFHPASCLAAPRSNPNAVAGAALIVHKPDGPFLDILFVRERWQHRGLGTALVGAVMNTLHESGAAHLGSAYNVGNAASVAWHRKFGFVEQPNAALAAARVQIARHELWRRTAAGDLTDADRAALVAEATHWEQVVESLDQAFSRLAAGGARRRLSPA